MTPPATLENVLGTWAHCVALSIACAEHRLSEDPPSIERRRRMAQLALEEPIDLRELLDVLREQRQYMRKKLEGAGVDPTAAFQAVVRIHA